MSQVSREDHFVPRFYLVGFTDTGGRKGKLWQFDGADGTKTADVAKKLGRERDYHTVDIEGHPPDVVESLFGKIENVAAPLLRTVIETQQLPSTRRDRADLMMFVALSYPRGLQFRQVLTSFHNQVETMKIRMALISPEFWEKYVRACEKNGLDYPQGSYEELARLYRQDEAEVEVANMGHIHTTGIVKALEGVTDLLMRRNWGLEITDNPDDFYVTSDSPATLSWISPDDDRMGPPGLISSVSEVVLPIHKSMALVGRYEHIPTAVRVDGDRVAAINAATARFAHRFVYSPHDDFVWKGPNGAWMTSAEWFGYRRANRQADT